METNLNPALFLRAVKESVLIGACLLCFGATTSYAQVDLVAFNYFPTAHVFPKYAVVANGAHGVTQQFVSIIGISTAQSTEQLLKSIGTEVVRIDNRLIVKNAYHLPPIRFTGQKDVAYEIPLGALKAGKYSVELQTYNLQLISSPAVNQRTIQLDFAVLTEDQARKGFIEIPAEGSTQSGVGLISGWSCVADHVEVSINGGPRQRVPSESPRGDVESVCSHSNAGFGLLWNYNTMSEGEHTIQLYVKTVPIGTARKFRVVKPKGEFARDLSKEVNVQDFPDAGKSTTLDWREAEQRFGIKSVQ